MSPALSRPAVFWHECSRRLTEPRQYADVVKRPPLITTVASAQAVWLGGTTVLIDQPYPSFPDNMGHWAEVLVPLYNLLTSGPWRQSHTHVDTILFGNLQRSQLDVSFTLRDGLLQPCMPQCAVRLPSGSGLP